MSGSRASVKQTGVQGRASSWELVREVSWKTGWGLRQRPILEPRLALEMAGAMLGALMDLTTCTLYVE